MLFSFVLPAYKARFLRMAMDSILSQTFRDFELVIVNDASPEGLDAIVGSYRDDRIHYHKNKINIGGKDLVAQWNHCITYAKGDYLILASDDDVYHPRYLETMQSLIRKYPDVGVYRPRVQYIDENDRICHLEGHLCEYVSQVEYAFQWMKGYECIGRGLPFYVFRKDMLLQNGGFVNFPAAWFADDATVMAMAAQGMAVADEVLFSFRWSDISISTKRNDAATMRKKVVAAKSFCNWMHENLSAYDARSEVERFEKKYVLEGIDNYISKHIVRTLLKSNIKDVLENRRFLTANGYTSFRVWLWVVRLLVREKCIRKLCPTH